MEKVENPNHQQEGGRKNKTAYFLISLFLLVNFSQIQQKSIQLAG